MRGSPTSGAIRCIFATFALMLSSCASTVLAQDAADDDEAYRTLIHDAVTEGNEGHYQESLALFLRAHEMRPSARTLRGIGLVRFELSDYAGAIRALSSAIEDTRRPLNADARAEAETTLERARQFVAQIELHITPEAASVGADGRPVELGADRVLLLNPGRHQLTIEHEGYRSETRLLILEGGQRERVELSLMSLDAVDASAPDDLPVGVRVRLEGNRDDLALHAFPISVEGLRPAHSEVCVVPCEAHLSPGTYQLAISRQLEPPIRVGEHPVREPSHLLLEYGDREGYRIAGYVTLPLSIAITVGTFFFAIIAEGTLEDLVIVAAGLGTLSLGFSLSIPMMLINNTARVTIEPLRAHSGSADGR